MPGWWYCLDRFRRYGLVGGRVSLRGRFSLLVFMGDLSFC